MKINTINSQLWMVLQWVTIVLIVKVWINIVANYVDYFPANFESHFLAGRQSHFRGAYRVAFYAHISSTPIVLLLGMPLLSLRLRQRRPRFHRWAGRLQVALILLLVVPSGLVMANYSIAGPVSNAGFIALSLATAVCTWQGWRTAVRHRFLSHRKWMVRSYILLCSAVILRLIGGFSTVFNLEPFASYRFASWGSWLIPLACFELFERGKHWLTAEPKYR